MPIPQIVLDRFQKPKQPVMVDADHHEFLMATLAKPGGRRLWLDYKLSRRRIDLSAANFSGWSLRNYDLSDANLAQAIFLECDLTGSDFSDAQLCHADLRKVNLRNACLDRADLRMAILNEASLIDACLANAFLKGAHLAEADLTGADLTGANLSGVDLRGASLKFARLTGATFKGANLANANLTGAVLDPGAVDQARNAKRTIVSARDYQAMPSENFKRLRAAGQAGGLVPFPAAAASQTGPGAGPDIDQDSDESSGPRPFSPRQYDVEPDLDSTAGCYLVLEVPLGASLDQIVKAFRRKAKMVHPDMVRHLPEKLQQLASLEFQRLHRAYERLTRTTTRTIEGANVVWPEGLARRDSPHLYTIEEYELLARFNPASPSIIYNLGWKCFEAERHAEAAAYFQRVLELAPNDEDASYNLMICRICIELMNATAK